MMIGCTGNHTVRISGTVKDGQGSSILLQQLNGNRIMGLDSTEIGKNQTFKFKTSLEYPELLILKSEDGKIINLMPSPGESVYVETSISEFGTGYSVKGSPDSEKIRELVIRASDTRHLLDSLSQLINQTSASQEDTLKLLRADYNRALIGQKRYTIRFIMENMRSPSAIYALYQKLYQNFYIMDELSDLQYFKVVADSMLVYHPHSSLTLTLVEDIRKRERQYQQQINLDTLLSLAETRDYLEVSLPDTRGDTISLTSLKDRVIMLIFWSSRDANSVKSLINLQRIYKKYHKDGFEVYAVSLDSDRSQWISSINFNQFDWINVSELSYPDSETDRIYNVTKLPTNFLINRKGELMVRDIYGRDLEVWLDNLL
jgi:peroxiredoxin